MPKIEIDGREITVEDGLNIIQAAERLDIEVPHYCYHPGLSISGNCRMCLVEIEKMPKLQIACNTRVNDGMVIHTTSPKVKAAQSAVLEFILINHPVDCPICDQAGECKLQDYYMDYGAYKSQMPIEAKVEKDKAVEIGPPPGHARPGALYSVRPLHPVFWMKSPRPASWGFSTGATTAISTCSRAKRWTIPTP